MPRRLQADVQCIVTVSGEGAPMLTFEHDVLQKIASIGATLDIDIYTED